MTGSGGIQAADPHPSTRNFVIVASRPVDRQPRRDLTLAADILLVRRRHGPASARKAEHALALGTASRSAVIVFCWERSGCPRAASRNRDSFFNRADSQIGVDGQ